MNCPTWNQQHGTVACHSCDGDRVRMSARGSATSNKYSFYMYTLPDTKPPHIAPHREAYNMPFAYNRIFSMESWNSSEIQ